MATANYTDGELIVTVPKGAAPDDDDDGDGVRRSRAWRLRGARPARSSLAAALRHEHLLRLGPERRHCHHPPRPAATTGDSSCPSPFLFQASCFWWAVPSHGPVHGEGERHGGDTAGECERRRSGLGRRGEVATAGTWPAWANARRVATR
ncbi:hypothetical protein OsJ_12505 [Oryza sativa Japonica Group]|uniref:Uncharacterized protein n=2 Tax=Oryza sativa subsp. japonica TaxID=39947 RepID=B9FBQ6_ORYSJ|nr:hypothetical protein OsJ_12505 [Oryza sativa Japonica Group]